LGLCKNDEKRPSWNGSKMGGGGVKAQLDWGQPGVTWWRGKEKWNAAQIILGEGQVKSVKTKSTWVENEGSTGV